MTVSIDFRLVFSAPNEMRPRYIRPSFGTATAFATPYSCDARGSRTARIDPRGNAVYFSYRALCRMRGATAERKVAVGSMKD